MTKKDYEIIASAFVEAGGADAQGWQVMLKLCQNLKAQNPRFDADIFVKACGFEV